MWHPDCKPHEEWVGNTDTAEGIPDYLKDLKSIRLDGTAYDIEGIPLPPEECRPMIMSAADADKYNQIMEDRLKRIRRGERLS